MRLSVTQEAIPKGTRRNIHLTEIPDRGNINIFYDFFDETLPAPTLLDGFVYGILFYAMRIGQQLDVEGQMSRDALININEFQEAWTMWRPEIYKKINIKSLDIIDHVKRAQSVKPIAAFSGGVDSVFTALKHSADKFCGTFDSVCMIHGFDVPLNKPKDFDALTARVDPLLRELNLKLKIVTTNLKELGLSNWEDSFSSQLASCLHNYSHSYCYGLIASSEPYNALIFPWGSNPCTDHLLSGATMRILHDGAGFSRTDKVAVIARNPTATRVLNVCWEGPDRYRNCGVCEKCVRTRLNFLAVGVESPPCFDTPFALKNISKVLVRNLAQNNELASILAYAKAKNMTGTWLDALEKKVSAFGPPSKTKFLLRGISRRIENAWLLIKSGECLLFFEKIKRKFKALYGVR